MQVTGLMNTWQKNQIYVLFPFLVLYCCSFVSEQGVMNKPSPLILRWLVLHTFEKHLPLGSRQRAPPVEEAPSVNHKLQAASLCIGCPLQASEGTKGSCWIRGGPTPLDRWANTRRHKGAHCRKVGQPILQILSRGLACFHLSLGSVSPSAHSLSYNKKARQ